MSAFEQTYLMKVPEKLTVIVDSDMDIFRINKLPHNWELELSCWISKTGYLWLVIRSQILE